MAYNPPFSGGHFNATIGGNTAGAGALVSSGTLTLAGGNNITLSQAGNIVTISAGAAAVGTDTIGMSNLSNTSGISGVISGSGVQYLFAGGNNITLSQSLNGSSGTLTVIGPTQSVQTQNMVSVNGSTGNVSFSNANNVTFGGNASTITASASFNQSVQTQSNVQGVSVSGTNTAGVLGNISTGTLYLAGGSNITLSQSNNSITISGAAGGVNGTDVIGMSNLGNTSGSTGVVSGTGVQYFLAGGNNITLNQSLNGASGTVSIVGASQSVQTQNLVSVNGSTGNMSFSNANNITFGANASTITASASFNQSVQTQNMVSVNGSTGNVSFSNANNITFGANASTVTASASFNQTNQSLGMFATGVNTVGQSTSTTMDARSMYFSGQGNVSIGYSGGTVQISGSGGGGGGGGVGFATGGTTYTSGTIDYSNAGGALTMSLSSSNNGLQTFNFSVPQTSSLSGTGAASVSTNGSTVFVGAPNVSSLSGTGGVSISTNGSTISIGAPTQAGTVSDWEPMPVNMGSWSNTTLGNSSVYFYQLTPGGNVSASQMLHMISVSGGSSSNSSWAGTISLNAGLYTAVSSQSSLNLITQSSGSASFTFSNTSSNNWSLITGLRALSVPLNVNMTAGNYWLGIMSRTTYANSAFSASNMVVSGITSPFQGLMGQAASASAGLQEAVGYWSASTTALPTAVAMSQITQTNLHANLFPYVIFKNEAW